MRDKLLNRELFDTLGEEKAPAERGREEYNRVRPHCALGCRPSASETIEPMPPSFAKLLSLAFSSRVA